MQDDRADDDHEDEHDRVEVDAGHRLDLHPFPRLVGPLEVELEARQGADQVIFDGDGLTADQRGHAAREEHACQRGDKRRHVQVLYAGAHQKPQPHAHKQREGNADDRVQAHHGGAVGDDHASQGGDSRHRQVDAARDQHHCHAYGGNADIGIIAEQQHEGAQGGKALAAVEQRAEQVEQGEYAKRRVDHQIVGLKQPGRQALAGGP